MDARSVTKATKELLSCVENSTTELEGILKKLELVPESPEMTTHKPISKKHILTKNFINNLLRASIKHLPLFGPFLYDVIYGTIDSQTSQKETIRQTKPLKTGSVLERKKPVAKDKEKVEKWYQNRTIQAALIGAAVLLLISIIGGLITLYINKPKADSGEIETIPSENKLLLSLKDICQDIDNRPLVQRKETAGHYVGMVIEKEPMQLFEIIEDVESSKVNLLLLFPGEPYQLGPTGWKISVNVDSDLYPFLKTAKRGLQLMVSGRIEHASPDIIELADVSLKIATNP